eukprot:14767854-Alexandrium_andersonii.AAC.1
MSASLVGSEMCIRDRRSKYPEPPSQPPRAKCPEAFCPLLPARAEYPDPPFLPFAARAPSV